MSKIKKLIYLTRSLVTAGSVFVHYLSELKEEGKEFRWIIPFDRGIILSVLIVIIGGYHNMVIKLKSERV